MNEQYLIFIQKRGESNWTKNRLWNPQLMKFFKKGYKATGISEIARQAHMAVGSFYNYYESKEAIFFRYLYWWKQPCSPNYDRRTGLGNWYDWSY